ncbi:MAG: hypothetical protein LC803_11105 [Acidobacteria bacterium]|nr:hypothetical protein [Acidobacteriota bacterium]
MRSTKDHTRKRELVAQLLKKEGVKQSTHDRITPRSTSDELPLSFAQQRLR